MAKEIPLQMPDSSGMKMSRRSFITLATLTAVELGVSAPLAVGGTAKEAADKPVAVLEEPSALEANRAKAQAIAEAQGGSVTGLGRIQLSLDGSNQDWCPVTSLPQPAEQNFSPELRYQTSHPRKLEDPQTGQGLNTIVANGQGKFDRFGKLLNPADAVTVYFGLYRNEVSYRESNYRVAEIARQMPDRVLFAFDPPNMGDSDPLTQAQEEGLANGSLNGVVDAHVRVLADKGVKKINLAGQSMGARLALTTATRAAEHGIAVENVLLYEIPGVEQQDISLFDIYGRLAEENKYLDLHHSNHFDNTLFEASGLDRPDYKRILESAWFTATNFADDPWAGYARVCAKAQVEGELERVFETTDANVLIGNGEKSLVSPIDDVFRIRNHFRQQYGSRMGVNIMEGVGHFAFAHPKDLAFNMKLNLNNQPVKKVV